MNDDIKMILDELKVAAEKALTHVAGEVGKLRAGKATPSMLDSVTAEYYESQVPLSQVANVNTPDAKTIRSNLGKKECLMKLAKG